MDFPIGTLLDEAACYAFLLEILHPGGLVCPRCGSRDYRVHRRTRDPVLDYRCPDCRRVFNAFTGTALHKTHYRPSELVLVIRGFSRGESTAALARELKRNRPHLLGLRHRLQTNALAGRATEPLPDKTVEADEMFQNAGEKRDRARRPSRPASSAGQQSPGSRRLGRRSPAGLRRGRA